MVSLAEALQSAARRLELLSESPGLDAQTALGFVLGRPRAWLLAHPEYALTGAEAQHAEGALQRLEAGEPLPYLLGRWEFYGLEFEVGPEALIPRPETELLVEGALEWLGSHPGPWRAVDVGTGTGCIAVSVAFRAPGASFLAVDWSMPALQLAQRNAARHGQEQRITLIQADLLSPFSGRGIHPFHLVCANLPYIPTSTLAGLHVARAEPLLALDGGPDGLSQVRRLLEQARGLLAPGGRVLVEIEASQGQAAQVLGEVAFPQAEVRVRQDLAGRDRLLCIDLA